MKEHFSSRVTKLLVILALAIVASVMFVIVGCGGNTDTHTHTWVADSSKTNVEATCSTDGVNYFICSECGMTSTETIPCNRPHLGRQRRSARRACYLHRKRLFLSPLQRMRLQRDLFRDLCNRPHARFEYCYGYGTYLHG